MKETTGRPRRRCEDSIKMYVIEIVCGGMNLIDLAQDARVDSYEFGNEHLGSVTCWEIL
jgi:hypothetical protein